jgi:SNF2 family DNA or RNA helicase
VKVRARCEMGGAGVELVPADGDVVALSRLLRRADPPVRARRVGGRLLVGYADVLGLGSTALEVDYDLGVQRAIDNRRRVQSGASAVLDAARRVVDGGPDAARALIADSDLTARLDDHQAVNVAAMVVADGWGTCVFDEQGTGKTVTVVTAFDLLVERGEADLLIVVAPKSMIAEWAEEFRRFTGNRYRVAVADGSRHERARAINIGADVVVVNYESVVSLAETLRLLARRTRAVLAVDESFFVKNPVATRTRAVKALREWCGRCFVLCGTPAPNSPHDLVAQFDLVDFGRTFAGVRLNEEREVAAEQVKAVLDRHGFFVRNLKRDVLPHLPLRSFSEVTVRLAPQQQAAYAAALHDLVLDLRATSDEQFHRQMTSFLERRAALLRICSDPGPLVPGYDELPAKLTALDMVLADFIDGAGEKVVVWSFYRAALDRIAARYARYGVARIDGSVSEVAERRDAVRRFQEDDQTMVFLGNPAAAGAGLTLHRSRLAVYESLSNQAAHFLQSLDRIHRRGQRREVQYVTLLADGTIEPGEYQGLLDKADRQADLLGDGDMPRVTRRLFLQELLATRPDLAEATP